MKLWLATFDLFCALCKVAALFGVLGCQQPASQFVVTDPPPQFVVTETPDVESVAASQSRMVEADHRDRIADAWRAAGIDCQEEVATPSGARCDLLTPTVAFELDYARKWAEGVGQARCYAAELDRRQGLILLVDDDDDRYVERARIAGGAELLILQVPLTGPVPVPSLPTAACTCTPKCDCEECHCGETELPAAAAEPVRDAYKLPPLTIDVWERGCAPCDLLKSSVPPALKAAGWVEGKHYRIVVHAPGSVAAPSASWRGKVFAQGFGDLGTWLGKLRTAMGAERAGELAERQGAVGTGYVGPLPRPVASLSSDDNRRHSHQCDGCGRIWWHTGAEAAARGHDDAHRCRWCGRYQNVIYRWE